MFFDKFSFLICQFVDNNETMHLNQRRSSFDLKAALLTSLWGSNIRFVNTKQYLQIYDYSEEEVKIIDDISQLKHITCAIWDTRPKRNCCKFSFAYNLFSRCPIPLKFCTEHGSMTAYLYNISKRFNNWNGRYGCTRFREIWD